MRYYERGFASHVPVVRAIYPDVLTGTCVHDAYAYVLGDRSGLGLGSSLGSGLGLGLGLDLGLLLGLRLGPRLMLGLGLRLGSG